LTRRSAVRRGRGFEAAAGESSGTLALHYELGGDLSHAATHCGRAGLVAQSRYSFEQAVAQLRHALDLLRRLPASAERDAREIDLQSRLSTCVFSMDGPGAAELEDISGRIETLSRTGETTPALLTSLFALIALCITRGDLARAEEACERVVQRASVVEWGEFFVNVARGLF